MIGLDHAQCLVTPQHELTISGVAERIIGAKVDNGYISVLRNHLMHAVIQVLESASRVDKYNRVRICIL